MTVQKMLQSLLNEIIWKFSYDKLSIMFHSLTYAMRGVAVYAFSHISSHLLLDVYYI